MKKNTHPKYSPLKIKIGSDVFETMSSCGKDEILMDVDYRKHPAWTKKGTTEANAFNQNVSAFNQKFGSIKFGAKKS